VIMGAQKAGTTAMRGHLRNHSDIYLSVSETHWFDKSYGNTDQKTYYEKLLQGRDKNGLYNRSSARIGDCTPRYLYVPRAAYKIKESYPDVKLIVLIRDPIARAFSEYAQNVGKLSNTIYNKTFLDVVRMDIASYDYKKIQNDTNGTSLPDGEYAGRGVYIDQLERLSSLFNRTQIHVLCSEQLFMNQNFSATLRFIGVEPINLYAKGYKTKRGGSYTGKVMEDEAKQLLRQFYRKYNLKLISWIQNRPDTYYFDKEALLKCVRDWETSS
jgi:hypothetical protein